MNTLTKSRITVYFAHRVLKWTGWGLVTWLLLPVLNAAAATPNPEDCSVSMLSLQCQDAESAQVQGAVARGIATPKPAAVADKTDGDWLAEFSHLRGVLADEASPSSETLVADDRGAEEIAPDTTLPISDEASALAADYRLSWESDLSVVPMAISQPAPALAQADDVEIDPSDGLNDAEELDLARQSQNPVANLISVPFQNNTNFGVGQFDRISNILNIQPVLPTPLSEDLLLINRFIVPLAYQPELAPGVGNTFGLGDILYQGFLSPTPTGNFSWGAGPAISFPTATDKVLGSGKWSIGPAAVGIWSIDNIVTGALINNIWSFAGDGDRQDVSFLTFQPFFNYNLDDGWFINTAPIITANWEASGGDVWTVPIGAGFGRVFAIGQQPVNMSAAVYWNAIRPDGAAEWNLRLQMNFLFPQ
jgi:hypothetical protein